MALSVTGRRAALPAVSLTVLGALALTGCGAAQQSGGAATGGAPPSSVPSPAASTAKSPTAAAKPGSASPSAAQARPAAAPTTVEIPVIGVRSPLIKLGLRPNRSLEVPPDGPGAPAGWYGGSPSPGETGPAVLLGHVNATGGGPGVFADLRALKNGAEIKVTREDGSAARFAVYRAAAYSKNSFPTLEVYGNTKASELRLITCDGYDPATGEFDDNYVVYAKLTSLATAKAR
jgi:sortase (surface protein transpeptidase)